MTISIVSFIIIGPSTQTDTVASGAAEDETITFTLGGDDTIEITFILTDDLVALETVEQYTLSLSLPGVTTGIMIVDPDTTEINILDDDGKGEYILYILVGLRVTTQVNS